MRIPAICGGEPAFPQGPPTWTPDADAVAAALAEAVARGSWNAYRGPNLAALVERFAELTASEFVLPCSSGTVAVEIALAAVGVGEGDEVILGGYDFPGNFRSIEARRAAPVLVDLDPATRCLDAQQVAAACGPRTKAVVASHLHNDLINIPALMAVASERKVAVVEDACQSVGGTLGGRPVGSWGDVGVFSFGGSKLLSAGRGGAVVTNRPEFSQRAKVFTDRGNQTFPLSELQATVLLPQLHSLRSRHDRRLAAVAQLRRLLHGVGGLAFPVVPPAAEPGFYKLGMTYPTDGVGGHDRSRFLAAARAEGIALDAGFRGFATRGSARCRRVGELSVSKMAATSTMLLHHPVLLESDETIDLVGRTLADLVRQFEAGTLSFDVDNRPDLSSDEGA